MRFKCTFCSFINEQDDSFRGYKIACPSCGKTIMVPINRFENSCVIGDFLLEEKIGEGSIGAVYRAEQLSLERIVALKILYPEYTNSKGISDFLNEARAAAKLSHPNLVQALAVGEENGTCYMAMTYIKGETVKAKIKRDGKVLVDEALHIVQQVAEALYYAWDEAKIIHRDVKPDNIMLTEDGVVKLTDLGLAMHQKDWRENMEISGSPSYMSPEQFAGEKLDTRSDIYSLGITLYQMLSGELPFDGETLRTVAAQHFEQEPPPLGKLNRQIPANVSNMVRKMMAKLPEERYSSMEDLLKTIWTIRQKTAPDKDMVPDVHTISINRLDYTIQSAAAKEKKAVTQKYSSELKEKTHRIYKSLIIAVPVFILILLLFLIYLKKSNATISKYRKNVEAFKVQSERPDLSKDALENVGMQLMKQFEKSTSPEIMHLHALVRLYLAEAENRKLLEETKNSELARKRLEKQISSLKKELDSSANKKASTAVSAAVLTEKNKKESADTSKILVENKALTAKINELNASLKKLSGDYEAAWKKDINLRLYSMIGFYYFKDAAAMVEREAARKSPKYKTWFWDKFQLIEHMEKIYSLFNESSSKPSGISIGDEGKLIMIDNGEIHYKDNYGNLKIAKWDEISPDCLFNIARKNIENIPDADLKAEIGILRGMIGYALKQYPLKNKNTEELCNTVYAQTLDRLKGFVLVDKKKNAAKIISTILKQLEDARDFDKYKAELRAILPEEE